MWLLKTIAVIHNQAQQRLCLGKLGTSEGFFGANNADREAGARERVSESWG